MNTEDLCVNPCAEALGSIGIFQRLSYAERQKLASLCHFHRYPADREIISYQSDKRDVFFIVSGQAQAIVYSMAGKQLVLNDLGPGDMFGELSAIDGQPRSASIKTLSEAVVCCMSYGSFWYVLHHYPSVSEAILRRLSRMVRELCQRVYEISTLPVRNRVHVELLRLALRHKAIDNQVTIEPAPTHTDIASHIGTHREAVSRELTQMKSKGIVARQNSKLIISDLKKLHHLVHREMIVCC